MKRSIKLVAFCIMVFASVAGAYEYPLQFTPNVGYRGLTVAGYGFDGNTVVGNCSYYTTSGASGKGGGGRGSVAHTYAQTCRWDLYGNLLSITPGAPPLPPPLYTKGTQVVYAVDANGDYTGTDSKLPERGFVFSPGSHYTWLTPNNNGVLQQMAYSLVATLKSDGDVPVNITDVQASALLGIAAVKSSTCNGQIDVGKTCAITVTYDTTKVTSTTRLAYDQLHIDLTSDAGGSHDFIQEFTIVLPQP